MSLSKLISKAIDKTIEDIQLGMICKIVSFDKSKMRADVQPLFKIKNDNDEEMTLPILPDLPVLFYSGGGYYIRPFYEKDDLVWVGFSTHDIQDALQGYTRAASEKKFELHNGCVLGGIFKDNHSEPSTFGKDGLILGYGNDTYISINKSGDIEIKAGNVATEKTLLGETTKAWLEAHTHPTGTGPSGPPAEAATLSTILSAGVKNN